ncbi:hypothetical protein JXM83_04705 [Candidatus Woesearchaeota archaeon]|nr:hypothetical protein [Candidatus Woesearchaeota archaeon]
MVRLSERAIKVISDLEFQEKYYFTREDIEKHFDDKKQLSNFIHIQMKSGRVVKLNRDKYFLIPIKARTGKWTDHPLIVADEMMNGKDYYVGGWYAAKYWSFTDQIPMQIDIYTTKRNGRINILNKRYVFHRVRLESLKKAVSQKVKEHNFKILNKEDSKKWYSER